MNKARDIRDALSKGDVSSGQSLKKYFQTDLERLEAAFPHGFTPSRLSDLQRHLHYSMVHDYDDIMRVVLPAIRFDIERFFSSIPQASIPVEIRESIERFRDDFPDPTTVAFVMMQFKNTPAHLRIFDAIKQSLVGLGANAVRADSKQYHDDLFFNVLTYVYGCRLGIAVFERIESEDFNPNVSLEVGYIMALGKPVCLLKDRTLKTLHTDLIGKPYHEFDPQVPEKAISSALAKWLKDKGLARK